LRDQAALPLAISDCERLDRDLDRFIRIGCLYRAEAFALLAKQRNTPASSSRSPSSTYPFSASGVPSLRFNGTPLPQWQYAFIAGR
jgi:hypothetical protein